jgi:hypothetical protein
VIAVNTSFRLTPWADSLFAMDGAWWKVHAAEIRKDFRGECLGYGNDCAAYGARPMKKVKGDWTPFGNSGAGAIAIAALSGAARVLMLGYDCRHGGDGKRHWHGDHPPGTAGNAAPQTVAKWPAQFRKLRDAFPKLEIINCTRETALDVFPRARLEDVLT